MKRLFHILCLCVLSFLMTVASLRQSSISYEDAAVFGIATSPGASDYRKTTQWGWPFPFLTDHVLHENVGLRDRNDILTPGFFIIDGVLWFLMLALADGAIVGIWWSTKKK